VIARKDGTRVKLYSRPGNDLTDRFPLIVEALNKLRPRSCIIDGEAVACGVAAHGKRAAAGDAGDRVPPQKCPQNGVFCGTVKMGV
jgi:hypothetical protein